ncbi:MAG: SpoIID/LytB domain-containing protein [Candidatus Fimenecus sp.]
MNMKLLALTADRESVSGLLERISGALRAFSEEDTAFACFPTLKAMLPQLAALLKNEECIVLAIDKAKYNSVRAKLCAALALPTVQNEEIYTLLSENTGLSPDEKVKNAAVPENAVCFFTEDGMYPGFAVRKGAQTMVFLPLDEERLERILKAGLVPYLMQCAVAPAEAKDETPAVPAQTEPAEIPVQDSFPEADVMQHTVNILREAGAKVAVSGTPYAEEIKKLGEGIADFDSFFVFTPHVEDKGDYNLTDYVALTAKAAKELSGAQLGASISEIGTGDGGDYICITVADDKTAVVRKLYREEDESAHDFVADAAEELVELIGEKAVGKGAVGIEVTGMDASPEAPSFLSKKSGKITLSVIALVLVAAITVGCIFFVKEKKARDAERAAASTEAPATTQPVSVAEPEPEIETVVMSQFMYNEMRSGVQETPAEVTTQSAAGTAIDTSEGASASADDIPSEMIVNGKTMDAKEAVARMIEAEVSADTQPEALKAQAIAIYTYLKYRNTNWKITGVTLAPEYSDEVYNAVRAVFGEYLSFGDTTAFTPYFKLSAGRTTPADIVYGQNFPYLRAVECATDKTQEGYKTELIFSADDMKAMLTAYDATLELAEDPAEWIKVLKHDGAVNTGVGYVETVSVGGKEISGIEFIEKVMAGKNLPSQCFSVTYNTPTNEFTITVYGVGYGVGMSLAGADKMAATGSSYAQILSKFYAGAQLTA